MLTLGQLISHVNPLYVGTKVYDVWIGEPHPSQWDPNVQIQLLIGDRNPPSTVESQDIINIAVFPVETIYLVCEHEA